MSSPHLPIPAHKESYHLFLYSFKVTQLLPVTKKEIDQQLTCANSLYLEFLHYKQQKFQQKNKVLKHQQRLAIALLVLSLRWIRKAFIVGSVVPWQKFVKCFHLLGGIIPVGVLRDLERHLYSSSEQSLVNILAFFFFL